MTTLMPTASAAVSFCGINQHHPLPITPHTPWLAPLAGFTDLPFRLLCKEQGAAATCTEMVSAKGLIYGLQAKSAKARQAALGGTFALLATCAQDTPLVVQLFGEEAAFLRDAVSYLRTQGFRYFDLNMGCSVPKVTKTCAGAAMLRDIPNALCVAKAMIDAAEPGTVGFKMRLGWNAEQEVYLHLGRALEDLGAAWLTLHPRYAAQKFSGPPHLPALAALKQAVSIPVIASGDLFTAEDAQKCLAATGVDSVMFARGALNNPAIFSQYQGLLRQESPGSVTPQALFALISRHAQLAQTYAVGGISRRGLSPDLMKMRTVIPRYVRHLPNAKGLRLALASCTSWEHFQAIMHHYFEELPNETALTSGLHREHQ